MNIELLKDGCFLMIIGMGSVFIFIRLMIWAMHINAKIIKLLNVKFPEIIQEDKYSSNKKTTNNDAEIALAIACAFAQRKRN